VNWGNAFGSSETGIFTNQGTMKSIGPILGPVQVKVKIIILVSNCRSLHYKGIFNKNI